MMSGFGWAKNPMVKRIDTMKKDIPITLLYGSRSWIDHSATDIIKNKRIDSYFKLQVSASECHVLLIYNLKNRFQGDVFFRLLQELVITFMPISRKLLTR
jgi:hypothetical protein